MRKISAIYSIVTGMSVLAMWIMILLTQSIPEGTIEMTFHLVSEFLMASLLILGGYSLSKNKPYGEPIFIAAHSMLIYSVLNAAGYYGQRGNTGMTGMFIILLVISFVLITLGIKKGNSYR